MINPYYPCTSLTFFDQLFKAGLFLEMCPDAVRVVLESMSFNHIWDPGFNRSLRPIDVGTATILIKTALPAVLTAITGMDWMRFTWMDRLQIVSIVTLTLVQVEDVIAEHPTLRPDGCLEAMRKAMDSLVAVIEGKRRRPMLQDFRSYCPP